MPTLHRGLKLSALVFVFLCSGTSFAQPGSTDPAKQLYEQVKAFNLDGGAVAAKSLTFQRDRAKLVFDGTFYFTAPVNGRVTGAVFIGEGKLSAEVPPSEFEKHNVKRLLGVDIVESDFKTAVFRFSDDTAERIGKPSSEVPASDPEAAKLAKEHDVRILKQTGANLPARIALSILNQEDPGFFFATFAGGKRGQFSLLIDHQSRIPVSTFGINGGEKGLIFSYKSTYYYNEVWMAFHAEADYRRGTAIYPDAFDLVDVRHYDLNVDLREHKKALKLFATAKAKILAPKVRVISFDIGEDLGEFENWRLNKQMRLKEARLGGKELAFAQEDWEGSFTLFLPAEVSGEIQLELTLEGDFMFDATGVADCHYPRTNGSWFPRHGYLDRATFDLTFRHPKKLSVASAGLRVSEEPEAEDKDVVRTRYRVDQPIPALTFALAPFRRHAQTLKSEQGGVGDPISVEFYSLPDDQKTIKENVILAELDNTLRYFTKRFGPYPYGAFRAAYHPFGYGLGYPSLLMIPPNELNRKYTYYAFIAHETAHQWWGDIVSWRSYRDQWLSEGFAEYSGILYTGTRTDPTVGHQLLAQLRNSLRLAPLTETGLGKGRVVDVGPIILGHRLNTRKTQGTYQNLIYNKGALVLRMLHFLLSDPASGESGAFFVMMTDFVKRFQNRAASTDDFRRVANEHFAKSPIGRDYGLNNLDWFFEQYVHGTEFPSYEMEYQIQDQPDGKSLLSGTLKQENAPDGWFMILPVLLSFAGKQEAEVTINAHGPATKFQITLPARPTKVELDPNRWVLADNVSTKRVGK
ncbi:MAG TPA: M1 family aminopeptidase [Pyrinomonadaceae bacterium]|nr:M1 family aminopeptidase [Pyrinomonadaceae bacterium]